ncbi:MAG: hypothetical protein NC331_10235 [Lachnospiraceae bacterium]|nr:hypothetical protein [Lachnospiraceae bacterium]MCM1239750.1 hypothetical protein [Lachnospiraceae bacterium]
MYFLKDRGILSSALLAMIISGSLAGCGSDNRDRTEMPVGLLQSAEAAIMVPLGNADGSVQMAEETGTAGSEPLFPPELISALEAAFKENGWKGVREWLEEIGMLTEEELFLHFPLINEYRDQMTYEYEPYDAVSHCYQGPEDLSFICYLPEMDRGKYVLIYESGKSNGKRAYSVRLADLVDDVLVTVAGFDVQDNIPHIFRYEEEYYYIYGWKSGVSEEKGYDGFMLHKLSGNPKRETLLGQYAPDGGFVLTEREIFAAEKEEDLLAPSERRVGQFGYIVYDNRWDFEEERNLPYADDRTFERLKEAYEKLDLQGEFQQSDSETSVIYIEAFRKLVQNEAAFYDRETKQEYLLKDYEGVQLDIAEEGAYDPSRFEYYFFDADGDGSPELGILEEYPGGHSAFLYLFRYDADTEQYSLWLTLYPPYDRLLGTGKVLEYDGVHMKMDLGYYQLDREGEEECKAYLYYLPISMFEQLCLVMLPAYSDPDLGMDIPRGMERCGIYAREPDEWYFRVAEEQFWELETLLWDAYEASEEEREEVLYTYEELFGEDKE